MQELPNIPGQYAFYAGILAVIMLTWKHLKSIMDGLFDSWKQNIELKRSKMDLQIQEANMWQTKIENLETERNKVIKEFVEYISYVEQNKPAGLKNFNEWKYDAER